MKDYAEAAEYLGVTERFMRRLVAERRITFRKMGKFVRFHQSDLDAFAEASRVEPVGPSPLASVMPMRRNTK